MYNPVTRLDSLRQLTKYLTQGRIWDNSTRQIETIPLLCQNSSVSIVTTEKLSAFLAGTWDFRLLQKVPDWLWGSVSLCSVRVSSEGGLDGRGMQHVRKSSRSYRVLVGRGES